jgi:hypothetical protein
MKICVVRADGGVSILSPVSGKNPTPESLVEKWIASADPAWLPIVSWHEVSDLPARDEFRNAWVYDGSSVKVSIGKARDIHMDNIRASRNAELARLDVEQLKGRDVAAEKQRLRDLPSTIDLSSAKTTDDLRAIWPAELPRR